MPRILIANAGAGSDCGDAQAKARWFPGVALFTGGVSSAEEVTDPLYADRHFFMASSVVDDCSHTVEGLLRQWEVDTSISLIYSEISQASLLLGIF